MPDSASPDTVGRFGPIRWIDSTGSTNDDLAELARLGAAEGTVLVTDHQRAGRGRHGRRFEAPPGAGLLASVLLRPTFAVEHLGLVPLAVGLAVAEACAVAVAAPLSLKWPNDVLLGPDETARKVAGILVESVFVGDRIAAVVAGFGVNANWAGRFPAELADSAASLDDVTGAPVDRAALLRAVLAELDASYTDLDDAAGRDRLVERYRRRSATLGRDVEVELEHGRRTLGRAVSISPSGHLVVRDRDGVEHVIASGEVFHARRTG